MYIIFLHLGMVSALDEAVGNITSVLKERGFLDNALIVFTTDVSYSSSINLYDSAAVR